jgi:hypothetical protein
MTIRRREDGGQGHTAGIDDIGIVVGDTAPVVALGDFDLRANDGLAVNRPQFEDVLLGDEKARTAASWLKWA